MKEKTLEICYQKLTKLCSVGCFISLFFENDHVVFPSYKFADYKKGIHIGQEVIWLTGTQDIREEIKEKCKAINMALKVDKLVDVHITAGDVTPVDIDGVQGEWAGPHELDRRIIRRLDELLIEKKLKDARKRASEKLAMKT